MLGLHAVGCQWEKCSCGGGGGERETWIAWECGITLKNDPFCLMWKYFQGM